MILALIQRTNDLFTEYHSTIADAERLVDVAQGLLINSNLIEDDEGG